VLVERSGGPPGRGGDVHDLRIQVPALDELTAGRFLERGLGVRGPGLAHAHSGLLTGLTSALRAVGSFLSLAANGLRGLDVLGCLPQVQAAGFAVPRQRMWAGHGKLLGDVPRARTSGDCLHSVTLLRGDLVAALREEAVRLGTRIITGRRATAGSLARLSAGSRESAAGNSETADGGADLIVGADGIWSATRRVLDPSGPAPAYAGLYSVSGRTLAEDLRLGPGLDLEPGAWNMIYARHGAFIYLPAPDGSIWWSAQVAAVAPPELRSVGLEELAAAFNAEMRAAAIIRAAQPSLTATLHHVLAPVARVYGDRIVLVGDAAHPVGSGQGASMAIEDAVVLAQQMRQARSLPGALAASDRIRRERVGKMAATAAANRDAKTAGPVAARMRNLFMPVFFGRFYERATAWLYDYDPGTLAPASGSSATTPAR
jgi:salicylate hydroxylase